MYPDTKKMRSIGADIVSEHLPKYLTDAEVVIRYRGAITVGTLRNWRVQRLGPAYIKVGKAVLYPLDQLDAWDLQQTIKVR